MDAKVIDEVEAKDLLLPPGNFGWPVVGETVGFVNDSVKFTVERQQRYGNIFTSHLLLEPTVVLCDSKLFKQILLKEGDWVRSEWPQSTRLLLGNSVAARETDSVHRAQRKLFHDAALGPRQVEAYLNLLESTSISHLDSWIKDSQSSECVEMFNRIKNYTFDMAFKVTVGSQALNDTERAEFMENFSLYLDGLFSIPIALPGFAYYKACQARLKMLKVIKEQISRARGMHQANGEKNLSILDALIDSADEDGNTLSDDDLADQILVFLFAGHDTTASTTLAALMLIPYKADMMERLKLEQKQVVSKHGESLTSDSLKDMILLDATIKESMATIVPIGGVFRKVLKDLKIGDYKIPKGYKMLFSISAIQRFETNDPSKEKLGLDWSTNVLNRFNPDRWLSGEDPVHLNFGYGRRMCVGMYFANAELKVLLATLLRRSSWSLVSGTENNPWSLFPVPRPRDNLKLKFVRSDL